MLNIKHSKFNLEDLYSAPLSYHLFQHVYIIQQIFVAL